MDLFNNLMGGFQTALTCRISTFALLDACGVQWWGFCLAIGPLAGIALLIPVTYGLEVTGAIIMLAGIYYGAMFGGSTTSILMNIPGESASIVTCLDGYQMTRKGRAGAALFIAAWGSWVGGTLAVMGIMLSSPSPGEFGHEIRPSRNVFTSVGGLFFARLPGHRLLYQKHGDGHIRPPLRNGGHGFLNGDLAFYLRNSGSL